MSDGERARPERPEDARPRPGRIIGRHGGERPGPTVVVFGGIHGNEPAGTHAARRVLERLEELRPPFRGTLLAVTGNRSALARGQRFLERDLNRRWIDEDLATLRLRRRDELSAEDVEQLELLDVLDRATVSARGPAVFLDLHSTSGEGPPFACMSDTLANRKLALALPLPAILGLEEVIDGSMLGWLSDQGHVGVAVEGGQHGDLATVARHVAATWLVLVIAGCLDGADVPELGRQRRLLWEASAGLPRLVEVFHRHVVTSGDGFVMEPGHHSFERVRSGQLLARDHRGDIVARSGGLLLLPRYQGQGEDGFFLARELSGAWLGVSRAARRLHLQVLLPLLPGIRRGGRSDELVVEEGRHERGAVRLLHLFGYRRVHLVDGRLVYSRRRHGPPRSESSPGA